MDSLTELIPRYYEMKSEMDSYKKQCDTDNAEIKRIMLESNSLEESAGGYTAKLTIVEKEDFNELRLLQKLKAMGKTECIKTKEYVDMDVLENIIYNHELDPKDLADCKTTKTEYRLKVKKEK